MSREIAPGVDHLSVSSIGLYLRCPLRWKRRYLDRRYEPMSAVLVQGRAVHDAAEVNDRQKIASAEDLSLDDVTDAFSDTWDLTVEEASEGIDWGSDKPGQVKDQGAAVLKAHHTYIAPTIFPLAVERKWRLDYPDGLSLIGRIDLEARAGAPEADTGSIVCDRKVRGRRLSRQDADVEMQPDAYLAARRAEGDPSSRFDYHVCTRTKTPTAEIVPTERSDAALDAFLGKVQAIAREIEWRAENDHWTGAPPGSWWCSEKFCGFWSECAWGGLFARGGARKAP